MISGDQSLNIVRSSRRRREFARRSEPAAALPLEDGSNPSRLIHFPDDPSHTADRPASRMDPIRLHLAAALGGVSLVSRVAPVPSMTTDQRVGTNP